VNILPVTAARGAILPLLASALLFSAPLGAGETELRGHGGPVRALATLPEGLTVISGSFDQ